MKGASRLILRTGFISLFFLLYVHINLSLFSLSYSIHQKSQELGKQAEDYRRLKFEVNSLKAPNRLAEEIKNHSLKLGLPSEVHVFEIPRDMKIPLSSVDRQSIHPLSKGILDFFGQWVNVAQAKTEDNP